MGVEEKELRNQRPRIGILLALSLIGGWLLMDWRGPYGPLEAQEWFRRHFWADRHAKLYLLTDSPSWDYGVVKSCMPIHDLGETLRRRYPSLRKEDVWDCAGLVPPEEYLTRDRLAITFKERGDDFNLWDCLKTPEGLICK